MFYLSISEYLSPIKCESIAFNNHYYFTTIFMTWHFMIYFLIKSDSFSDSHELMLSKKFFISTDKKLSVLNFQHPPLAYSLKRERQSYLSVSFTLFTIQPFISHVFPKNLIAISRFLQKIKCFSMLFCYKFKNKTNIKEKRKKCQYYTHIFSFFDLSHQNPSQHRK